jgi:hypothetical protein
MLGVWLWGALFGHDADAGKSERNAVRAERLPAVPPRLIRITFVFDEPFASLLQSIIHRSSQSRVREPVE